MDLRREIGGGARIRAGIEFDAASRGVAYRVLSSRPGDPLRSARWTVATSSLRRQFRTIQ